MNNLDPRLIARLAEAEAAPPGEAASFARSTAAAGPAKLDVFVHFTGPEQDLTNAGLESPAVFPDPTGVEPTIAAGSIELSKLTALSGVSHVQWVDESRPLHPNLDLSGPAIGLPAVHARPPGWTGKGVVVGVVDDGLRFNHWTFRDPSDPSKSRVAFLWDVEPKSPDATRSPAEFPGVGIEYGKAELERLMNDPSQELWGDHGTHVAGIAVGNGLVLDPKDPAARPPRKYVGVAPEATLVMVKTETDRRLSTDVRVCRGVDYIFKKAAAMPKAGGGTEDLPCVVNLSLGDLMGPHDGTAPLEKAIDRLVAAKAGRVVVVSAGNQQKDQRHARGEVARGGSGKVKIDLAGAADTEVEVWYKGTYRLRVTVTAPESRASTSRTSSTPVEPGNSDSWTANPTAEAAKQTKVQIHSLLNHPWNGDNRITVKVKRPTDNRTGVPQGTWELVLEDVTPASVPNTGPVEWDAWSDGRPFVEYCRFGSVSIPGTARNCITVAAYSTRPGHVQNTVEGPDIHHDAEDPVERCATVYSDPAPQPAGFSNYGPTRDKRPKPDIAGPGVAVFSANGHHTGKPSSCCDEGPFPGAYLEKRGTSMAAPHVAGVVALMLQKNPTLTYADVRKHLTHPDSVDKPEEKLTLPDFRWGHGMLNAVKALNAVPGPAEAPPLAPRTGPDTSLATSTAAMETADAAPALASTAWAATVPRALPRAELRAVRDALQLTPRGRALLRLVSEHADEVRRLVNQHRRVAVAWRRAGGPGLVQGVLDAVEDRSRPLPAQAAGLPLAAAMEPVLHAFRTHGSPALAAAVDHHAADFLALSGAPLDAVLERMSAAATGG